MTLRRGPTLNLPNQLTVLRLGMCGLLLISMSFAWPYAATAALLIFALASLTDWLDGEIARRKGLVTDLGKLLDPLADKVLVTAALVSLVERHVAPMWMVVLIIAREFLITGLRIIAAHKQKILAAERVGKHKTISQIVAILISFSYLSLGEFGLQDTRLAHVFAAAQLPFYWFALFITVLSGAIYFRKNAAILNEVMGDSPEPTAAPAVVSQPAETAPAAPAAGRPAFKEWEAIVEALGHGAQIIILRKGGIAEGRDGFQARHDKFWLFPTRFHQQWEKTKPELRRYLAPAAEPAKDFTLTYFAEVTDAIYLSTWEQVERLRDAHFWGEEIVRERFDYRDRPGMEAGLHLLIVRVFHVNLPHRLAPSPDYGGCKSWIEVPADWSKDIAEPVVRAEEFATRRSQILAAVSIPADRRGMSALVLLAPGFEEIEGITVIDILRRAEIETVAAGLAPNPITAARGTRHLADVLLSEVETGRDFEIVILPGGAEGAKNLAKSPLVRDWLFRQRERGRWVAALCAAPTALLAHGWLGPERKIVAHPTVQDRFAPGQVRTEKRVVVDGKLITSLAAGSAMEFAFEIVRQLRGEDAVAKVNQGVCSVHSIFPLALFTLLALNF